MPLAPACATVEGLPAAVRAPGAWALERTPQFIVIASGNPASGRQARPWIRPRAEQVLKKTRRPTHGLAGIVQDVIEPRQPFEQEPREQLDARRMAQIEAMNL
jgi:hypothetical protein